jgi:hypothetical protein
MKVSFIVPCRNKAKYVGACVDSVLAQSYSPMEIILSDQGSTDETFSVLLDKADSYRGPNTVRLVSCPDIQYRGMAGLNAHLNWLHGVVTGDIVIMCSADDLNHPDRALYTVKAFEEHNPSYVGTAVKAIKPDGELVGESNFPDRRSRWIWITEAIQHQIGSAGSSAWAHDLYEKHGPLIGTEAQDMVLPPMALMERGLFFVDRVLHTYIQHADPNNTGTEGLIRSTEEGTPAWWQATEMNAWHYTSHWCAVWRRLEKNDWINRLPPEAMHALGSRVIQSANMWTMKREHLTMQRIDPKNMIV